MKKILALLLAFTMCAGLLMTGAAADSLPAAEDGVITLTEDLVLTETLTLDSGVTIEGGGCTIKAGDDFSGDNLIVISANVTMNNVVLDGNNLARVITVESGTLNTNACTIKNGSAGNGPTNRDGEGGGVLVKTGAVYNAVNTVIKNNTANLEGNNWSGGGGVSVWWDATFTMTGGEISGNKSYAGGGGIYNYGSTTVKGNAIIKNNWARYSGGGMEHNGQSALITGNVQVINNTSDRYSGGIFIDSSNCTVSGNVVCKDNFIGDTEYDLNCRFASFTIEGNPVIGNPTSGEDQEYSCSSVWGVGSIYANGGTYTVNPEERAKFVIDYENYVVIDNHNGTWSIRPYVNVSYESNGGSAVESEKLAYGATATEPADPTREGYVFKGWYTDAELTDAYDFSAAVTEDITLYAKWVPKMTDFSLSVDNDTIYTNANPAEATITVTPEPEGAELGELTATQEGDGEVAITVNEGGTITVTPVRTGTVTITVTTEEGISKSITLTVATFYAPAPTTPVTPATPDPEPVEEEPVAEDEPDELEEPNEAEEPDEEIEEAEVPLDEEPEEEEEVEVEEEELPLSDLPEEEEEIAEEDIPLDDSPETGDNKLTALWIALAVVSLAGVAVIVMPKKKEN